MPTLWLKFWAGMAWCGSWWLSKEMYLLARVTVQWLLVTCDVYVMMCRHENAMQNVSQGLQYWPGNVKRQIKRTWNSQDDAQGKKSTRDKRTNVERQFNTWAKKFEYKNA